MTSFFPIGTKFCSHGHTWIADAEKTINAGTGITDRIQVWRSNKTWLTIMARYDVRRETLKWEVERYATYHTRGLAAAYAARQTDVYLESYLLRLTNYGQPYERGIAVKLLRARQPEKGNKT
jgi:hypothetical protein